MKSLCLSLTDWFSEAYQLEFKCAAVTSAADTAKKLLRPSSCFESDVRIPKTVTKLLQFSHELS